MSLRGPEHTPRDVPWLCGCSAPLKIRPCRPERIKLVKTMLPTTLPAGECLVILLFCCGERLERSEQFNKQPTGAERDFSYQSGF